MQLLSDIRPFLETLYFIASIGLVAGLFIGLRQLKLLKEDMDIRYKRAAIEKSIEYLNWFATEFIPKTNKFIDDIRSKEIPEYEGPYNEKFIFDENCNTSQSDIRKRIKILNDCGATNLINELEYFSAALLSGLADEELAFNPLANIYCEAVETHYVMICDSRDDETSSVYSYTVSLYSIWKARIKKSELEKTKRKIDDDISKIKEKRITSLGS